MNEFITIDFLATFSGLVLAVSLIVQFTKSIVKKNFGDSMVRIYAFIIALILTFVFAKTGNGVQHYIVTLLNSILVTMAAIGGYEIATDPRAEK